MTSNQRTDARIEGAPPSDELWTYKETAAYLKVSERTVHSYADDPDHPLMRIKPGGENSRTVRFSRAVVEALGRQTTGSGASRRDQQEVSARPDDSS